MHEYTLENWQHTHNFSVNNEKGKQRTQYVLILTAITMVAVITAGSIFGSFGTGKVDVLGGFASAIALAVVALVMLLESVQRFINPLN